MADADVLQDWTLVQSFLAVAETGSLSAAAKTLGRSQPTLGRQIQTLEAALGASLFERHARGLRVSPTGISLLPHARTMRAALHSLSLAAAEQAGALAGTVRLTASLFLSHYVLPPVLAEIRAQAPEIDLELLASDDSESLHFQKADIALRMYRPDQLDLVTRHLAEIEIAAFAATSYLDRRGRPDSEQALRDHDLIGFDQNPLIRDMMRARGLEMARKDFAVRCDNQATYLALLQAGCGIGFTQVPVGRMTPGLEQLDLALGVPPLPLWIAAHEKMRMTPRIRKVWDLLVQDLPARCTQRD
ncbi:MAG: LysR family transcriptional regulator [Pseudomonadota bacterium]